MTRFSCGLSCLAILLVARSAAAAPSEAETDAARTARREWDASLPSAPKPALEKHGLVATELHRWPAREARQGAAVDERHFYAIGNFVIGKYDKRTGERVREWIGVKGGPIVHLNSGYVVGGEVVLSHSNFPQLPMASTVEWFDTKTLTHRRSRSLGIRLGSLTWAEWRDGSWWACFANYNDRGTTPGFDNRWTSIGRYDEHWQMQEAWLLPPQVIARFGESSCSGGSWGDDGLLYVSGHDAPELYVLRLPEMGATLEYVTTIDVPIEGQAWAWDRGEDRVIYGISRRRQEVIAFRVPPIPAELLNE